MLEDFWILRRFSGFEGFRFRALGFSSWFGHCFMFTSSGFCPGFGWLGFRGLRFSLGLPGLLGPGRSFFCFPKAYPKPKSLNPKA